MQYRFVTCSGWISLIANLLVVTGFLSDRWPLSLWRPGPWFFVVLSFAATALSLVSWSVWTWRRSGRRTARRGVVFLLNTLAVLPLLTIWLNFVLTEVALMVTRRWSLALAIAWTSTPFVALGLTWGGGALEAWMHEPGGSSQGVGS